MGSNTWIAVGGGGLSALASLAILFGSPASVLFAYLTPLPLMLVGLSLGANAAATAGAAGLVLVVVLGGFAAGGVYGGMHALPSWLLVHQALSRRVAVDADEQSDTWYPLGRMLAILAAMAAMVAASTALAGGAEEGIEVSVRAMLAGVLDIAAPGLGGGDHEPLVDVMAPVFIGFTAVSWQVMMVANALLAQSMLARRGWNARPNPAWTRIALPDWLSWLLVAAAVAGLFAAGDAGYLGRNLAIALAAPFFFAGLAAIHVWTRGFGGSGPLLALFYLILLLFFAFAAAIVAGIGMFAQWSAGRRVGGGQSS
jgi:hypothetical protein